MAMEGNIARILHTARPTALAQIPHVSEPQQNLSKAIGQFLGESASEQEGHGLEGASQAELSKKRALAPKLFPKSSPQEELLRAATQELPTDSKRHGATDAHAHGSKRFTRHAIGQKLSHKFHKISHFFLGKVWALPGLLVTSGLHYLSNSVVFAVMAQASAAGAASEGGFEGDVGVDLSGLPRVEIDAFKAAMIAGVLANGLLLAYALPAALCAVGEIIKGSYDWGKSVAEVVDLKSKLGKVRDWKEKGLVLSELSQFKAILREEQIDISYDINPQDLSTWKPALIALEKKIQDRLAHVKQQRNVGLPAHIGLKAVKFAKYGAKTIEAGLLLSAQIMTYTAKGVRVSAEGLKIIGERLGVFAAGLGIALGCLGMGLAGVGAYKAQKELNATILEIIEIEKSIKALSAADPKYETSPDCMAANLRLAVLTNHKHELVHKRKFCLLDFASSGMMTLLSVLGGVVALGVLTGPAGFALGFVALGIIVLSTGFSIGIWYGRRKGQKRIDMSAETVAAENYSALIQKLEQNKDSLTDTSILSLLSARDRKKGDQIALENFRLNPQLFLEAAFSSLRKGEDSHKKQKH